MMTMFYVRKFPNRILKSENLCFVTVTVSCAQLPARVGGQRVPHRGQSLVPLRPLPPTGHGAETAGLATDCRLGLRWNFCCRCPNSKPRQVLESSLKSTWDMYFRFFRKSQNELVWPCMVFLAILVPESIVVG